MAQRGRFTYSKWSYPGTKISVFGVVLPRESPGAAQVSEYSIDGNPSTQYTAPGNVTDAVYNLQFYSSGIYAQGQHTLTILNLGDEFIIGHFEVTINPTHFDPTESDPGPASVTISREQNTASSPSPTSTSFILSSTTQSSSSSSSQTTSANNGTLTSTNTSTASSTTLPPTSSTSTTSILPTSSSSPRDNTPEQDHTSPLSKGATIGGGIAGTLVFLFLVGGLCWWGQRRGRRKRPNSSGERTNVMLREYNSPCVFAPLVSSVSRPPLGMHNATSQITLGSDPFASDAARLRGRGPPLPLYIPVGSASDLSMSIGRSEYTPTRGSSRAGYYHSEKHGMDDVPLRSPTSTSNLLGSPTHHTFVGTTPRLETPVQVRRTDPDGRRRSADGGVRVAGGRPGQRAEDAEDSFLDLTSRKSTGSTLPPAYDFD